ncbi:LysR-family transcriptional regulator [Sphingobium chlorophenolicum]|uniref:LysR-family transcriptional regulator n=1 Tax=Sphingobium chlorophenolicum TaxID=46429 RepID=A0A081RA61_SPHCR|nr:LysR family transcriptional regulator [Sphingobium chlorophenolicum]KEQ52084.1 LysR-family transcriptional regulator [Sphingobium chlorophenolicum]
MPDLSLDLRYLRYALAASQHRSFRRAAAFLNVAQSTLTRRILLLEHRVGFRIFDRSPCGVRLTRAGQLFLEEASTGMQQLGQAVELAASVHKGERGELQAGVLVPLAAGRLHVALKEFHRRHPEIRVSLHEGSSDQNLARLTTGELDVSFLPGKPRLSGHASALLWTESIYVAFPSDHRLAECDEAHWHDLKDELFVVSQQGVGPEIRDYLIRKLSSPGFSPQIDVHDVSRESLMNIVAMGYGITLASGSNLGSPPGIVFRPIGGDPEQLALTAVWMSRNSNPALQRLLFLVKEVASGRLPQLVRKEAGKVAVFLLGLQSLTQSCLGEPARILGPFG